MSLAEVSEARKERLIALRRRKLGQEDHVEGQQNGAKYVFFHGCIQRLTVVHYGFRKEPFRFRQRNFDPETRTLVRHSKLEGELEDTVEKRIDGLAEQIIAEDEEKRNQELVS